MNVITRVGVRGYVQRRVEIWDYLWKLRMQPSYVRLPVVARTHIQSIYKIHGVRKEHTQPYTSPPITPIHKFSNSD